MSRSHSSDPEPISQALMPLLQCLQRDAAALQGREEQKTITPHLHRIRILDTLITTLASVDTEGTLYAGVFTLRDGLNNTRRRKYQLKWERYWRLLVNCIGQLHFGDADGNNRRPENQQMFVLQRALRHVGDRDYLLTQVQEFITDWTETGPQEAQDPWAFTAPEFDKTDSESSLESSADEEEEEEDPVSYGTSAASMNPEL